MSNPQLLFVVTPFLPEHQPALGVSTMVNVVRNGGYTANIRYLNVQFMHQIGWELYYYLSYATPPEFLLGEMALLPPSPDLLLGEMVFTPALWGDQAPDWDTYADRAAPRLVAKQHDDTTSSGIRRDQMLVWKDAREQIRALREESPRYIARWAREIVAERPEIVGFTSTFQQNMASLALAKEIRRLAPEITLIMGGGNCEGGMGAAIADNFPFLDYVVSGEGEGAILNIMEAATSGPRPERTQHVVGPMIEDMNSLPPPDFSDYFKQVEGTPLARRSNLAAESSRGCWWGAKSHCTFCGLNGGSMAFRSKDPDRFVAELRDQVQRYGAKFFMMADNILDMHYIRTMFPPLIEQGDGITMFYETKSNIRKDQLKILAAGGVIEIQPGIESLSTPILKLMGKGTTRLQNLQIIKWCEEFGMKMSWNILYGFPGEEPEEYDQTAELIPLLHHMPPPGGCGHIRLDRLSPYWRWPERYGLTNVRQMWSYDHVYAPLAPEDRARIAYFFQYDYDDQRDVAEYMGPTLHATELWRDAYSQRATLEVQSDAGQWSVLDTRTGAEIRTPISADERIMLEVLDQRCGLRRLPEKLEKRGLAMSSEQIARTLADFSERGWVIEEADKFFSLVLDRAQRKEVIKLKMSAQLGLVDWAGGKGRLPAYQGA